MNIRCDICGFVYDEEIKVICPSCRDTYRGDVETGHIPPGITKKHFEFHNWQDIRRMERDMRQQGAPEKVIADAVRSYAANQEKDKSDRDLAEAAEESKKQSQYAETCKQNLRSKYTY